MSLIPTTQVNVSPDDYKRKIAYALMQQGMDTSPVQAWTQGAARALQGALGGYEMYRDDQKQKADESDATKAYLNFLQPQGGQASPPSAPPQAPAAPPPQLGPTASALAKPTQMVSADPAAVTGPRPGGPVMSSPTVVGDAEAEAAGLYEPSKPGAKVAQALAPQAAAPMAAPSDDSGTKGQIAALLQSPNPQTRKMGQTLASSYITSKMTADNTPVSVGGKLVTKTGKVVYDGSDERTPDQKNFEYGVKNPTFRDYQKENKTPLVNIQNKSEGAAITEAAKIDAETVRKNQNEKMPALDDADHNFQIMQDAIARNGGKLPTGGTLGKLGLDGRRMSGYIRDNWGIDLGDDPTTAVSLETFNKGGIKASGDMAKAIGGNRVLKVEFDMAQRANPGLETTDGGNKYLLDVNRNTIAIQRDHIQAQEDYWRSHNHSLDGFQKEWNAEVKANPRPLSTFSVAPPVDNGDGSQMVKLPSTAQGGYSWYRKGQDGMQVINDKAISARLNDAAKPLKETAAAPVTKIIGGKTYVKQDGNWFEKN